MDPITAAALIGGGVSLLGAERANVASAAAAREQMDFQQRMSDTSYQRQVADLKAAGINPMLGYMKGSGASTPVGAMPIVQNVGAAAAQSFGQVASAGAASRQAQTQEKFVDQQVEKIKEEIKNIPLEGDRLKEAAYMLWSQAKLMHEQGATQREQVQYLRAVIGKLNEETGLLSNQAEAERNLENLGRNVKQLQPIIDLMRPFIGR